MSIKSSFLGVVVMVTITYLRISNFAGLSNPGLNLIHRILWISIVSNLFLFNYCLTVPCMTYDCTLPIGWCDSFICCEQLNPESPLKGLFNFLYSESNLLMKTVPNCPTGSNMIEVSLVLWIEIREAPIIEIHSSNFTGK